MVAEVAVSDLKLYAIMAWIQDEMTDCDRIL